jgi:hypothetical protein
MIMMALSDGPGLVTPILPPRLRQSDTEAPTVRHGVPDTLANNTIIRAVIMNHDDSTVTVATAVTHLLLVMTHD